MQQKDIVPYFSAQLGMRPIQASKAERPIDVVSRQTESTPCFTASIGPRPVEVAEHERPVSQENANALGLPVSQSPSLLVCPLCQGPLEEQDGLYRCLGRCGARWLAEASGRLIDLAALPFGICGCCRPPQALARGDQGTICPASARVHLLLPNGTAVLADALPYGTCRCCAPPMPLIRQGDALACLARPEQRYERAGELLILLAPPGPAAEIGAAVDTALRRNSARLTVNGLFDLD